MLIKFIDFAPLPQGKRMLWTVFHVTTQTTSRLHFGFPKVKSAIRNLPHVSIYIDAYTARYKTLPITQFGLIGLLSTDLNCWGERSFIEIRKYSEKLKLNNYHSHSYNMFNDCIDLVPRSIYKGSKRMHAVQASIKRSQPLIKNMVFSLFRQGPSHGCSILVTYTITK